jgi:DNA-binding transcriptional ArsR family regulator
VPNNSVMQCPTPAGSARAKPVARIQLDPVTLERCTARSAILKALAHPSRLFMVEVLAQGERCVCELTAMVGSDISTVSKHLGVLKAAGIVTDQKRGLQVYYTLRMRCVHGFLARDSARTNETGVPQTKEIRHMTIQVRGTSYPK